MTKLHEAALAAKAGTATEQQLDLLVQSTDPTITRQYRDSESRYLVSHLGDLYKERHLDGNLFTKLQMYLSTIDEDHAAWKETLIQVMKQPWKDPESAEMIYREVASRGDEALLGEIQRDLDKLRSNQKEFEDAVSMFTTGVRDSINNYMDTIDSTGKSIATYLER